MGCVFCGIADGSIPGFKVLDEQAVVAFLDINPLAEGHLLVIPRRHYERLDEMPGDELARLADQLPRLARAVVEATAAEGYNVLQNNGSCAGQAVGHVHFHIIPRVEADGLGYRWPAGQYGAGEDEKMRGKIVAALSE